jgi:hypothetical protein
MQISRSCRARAHCKNANTQTRDRRHPRQLDMMIMIGELLRVAKSPRRDQYRQPVTRRHEAKEVAEIARNLIVVLTIRGLSGQRCNARLGRKLSLRSCSPASRAQATHVGRVCCGAT